ncbi:hypothetical protein BN2476_610029 [Paraburkholderia piptadeniae]|uniref:Uncharacterized protein n=1 Tax=Paraburkholderia piptadeniae TaxID=1701573 RepID=A0A1N7SKJ3_9BURK|nr:hypothetical protein BN2476_610029 [Paraburkholderia piptadeniae]
MRTIVRNRRRIFCCNGTSKRMTYVVAGHTFNAISHFCLV